MQSLVEEADAAEPLPACSGPAATEDEFFAYRAQTLPLFKGIDVGGGEVLVEEHAVAQELCACHGSHAPCGCGMLDAQASARQ